MRNDYRYEEEDRAILSFRAVRTIILLAALVLAVAYVATQFLSSKTLPIRSVQIGGEFHYVDRKKVQRLISPLIKGNFFTVNIKAIHKKIKNQMWVDKVSIRRIWPDTLRIVIVEEKPLARWAHGGLITQEGEHMAARVRGRLMRLPFFKGPSGYQKVMAENYLTMSRSFARANLIITQVVVSARRAWSLRLQNGIVIRLGKGEVLTRANRLSRVFQSVLKTKVKDIHAIDLRYTNGFAVKWKSGKKTKRYGFGG